MNGLIAFGFFGIVFLFLFIDHHQKVKKERKRREDFYKNRFGNQSKRELPPSTQMVEFDERRK